MIEIMVHFFYASTLIIYMVKSRFTKIGVKNTDQFEPLRMRENINRIIDMIDIDYDMKTMTKEKSRSHFVGNIRHIQVCAGKVIEIRMNEEFFEIIFERKFLE